MYMVSVKHLLKVESLNVFSFPICVALSVAKKYQHSGTIMIIPPFKCIANLCGMEFAGYVYSGALSYASHPSGEKLKSMQDKAVTHAERLVKLLETC